MVQKIQTAVLKNGHFLHNTKMAFLSKILCLKHLVKKYLFLKKNALQLNTNTN